MRSLLAAVLVAVFAVPVYAQTKLDSGVILPKKHGDAKAGAKAGGADKAEKSPKSDKKAAKK